MAFTGHTTWYCSSARWSAVTAWATGATIAAGALRRQNATPTKNNERIFVAIVGGTTHATTEPTWVITRGGKTTDNTVTWQEITGIPALNGDLTHTPTWLAGAKSTSVTLGHVIKDNAGTHIFIADSAGSNSAGSGAEPTWDTSAIGNTTVDASVTWRYLGTSFGNWAAPHKLTVNMLTSTWGDSGIPTWFFIGDDHAENSAGDINWPTRGSETAPISIFSVNHSGSVPPGVSDLLAGASVGVASGSISLTGAIKICYGITFGAGVTSNMTMNNDTSLKKYYHTCIFTGVGGFSLSGGDQTNCNTEFENCTIKFASTSAMWFISGRSIWRNGVMFDASGTYKTTGFIATGNRVTLQIIGCDLSGLPSSLTLFANNGSGNFDATLIDCKLPASFALVAAGLTASCQKYRMIRCGVAGNDYTFAFTDMYGSITTETTAVRTGGAANATPTGFSWKAVTTTASNMGNCLAFPPISRYNSTTGADVTATICGIINAAAVPNTDEIGADFYYMGASGSPVASVKTTRVLGDFITASVTAITADTSAWDSVATARANTHAYSVGDMISLASNPGRLFFCTSAGTSAGSEPGGYASAVDGGSVTDSGATFRAGCRFKLTKVLTSPQPQLKGTVNAFVRCAKISTTWYIDPYLTLS